jgi:hypothetical protein
MGIYSKYTKTTVTTHASTGLLESVVFDEYQNQYNLLESCYDPNERTILEAKVEVLQEVTFSDIIAKIKKWINDIKESIKRLIGKIREKFTKKKQQETIDKLNDVEKKYEDLKKECDEYKVKYDVVIKNNAEMQAKYDDMKSDYDDMEFQYAELRKTGSPEEAERRTALARKIRRFSKAAQQNLSNPLMYFNMYDYMKKDFDPLKVIRSSEFTSWIEFEQNASAVESRNRDSLLKMIKSIEQYANILNPDVENYVKSNQVSLEKYINDDIAKKSKIDKIDKLLDQCDKIAKANQVSECEEIFNRYNSALMSVEQLFGKYFKTQKAYYDKNAEKGKVQPDGIKNMVEPFTKVIKLMEQSVQALNTLTSFSARAFTAVNKTSTILDAVLKDNYNKAA